MDEGVNKWNEVAFMGAEHFKKQQQSNNFSCFQQCSTLLRKSLM